MVKRTHSSPIGIACFLLLLVPALANAEIIRCTDNTGASTFTAAPCIKESLGVQAPAVSAIPNTGKHFSQRKKFAAAEKARSIRALNNIGSNKTFSLDERTVRGAKASADLIDIASALAREQASAEKALRRNPWMFWRL